jgi:UDP-N-acetylglucosamine acyltransferase
MKPYIGPDVRLGEGVKIHPFAYIEGHTTIGDRCEVFPHAAIGTPPHDISYKGGPTRVEVGADCVVREGATIHRASEKEEGLTRVGARCFLMAQAHVGHDCRVGDDVIITNSSALGGHVVVEDGVLISALAAVHQFCRVGTLAMVAGGSMVVRDVPPYCLAHGDRARLVGLNEVGLERHGFTRETLLALRRAYRTLFRSGLTRRQAIERARSEWGAVAEVERMLRFIESSKRGVAGHGRG